MRRPTMLRFGTTRGNSSRGTGYDFENIATRPSSSLLELHTLANLGGVNFTMTTEMPRRHRACVKALGLTRT